MGTQTSKCQVSKGYNPKNRHDFAKSEKIKKNTKIQKKNWKPKLQNARFRKAITLKTDTILQTVKRTSKFQVSKGYDPKNRHDFANSEKAKIQKFKIENTKFRRRNA